VLELYAEGHVSLCFGEDNSKYEEIDWHEYEDIEFRMKELY
jgi:hypothetical protein